MCDVCGKPVTLSGDLTKCYKHTDLYALAVSGDSFTLEHQRRLIDVVCMQTPDEEFNRLLQAFMAAPSVDAVNAIISHRINITKFPIYDSMAQTIALLDLSDNVKIDMLKPLASKLGDVLLPLVLPDFELMERVMFECHGLQQRQGAIHTMLFHALYYNLPALKCLSDRYTMDFIHVAMREHIEKCRNVDYLEYFASIGNCIEYLSAEQRELVSQASLGPKCASKLG